MIDLEDIKKDIVNRVLVSSGKRAIHNEVMHGLGLIEELYQAEITKLKQQIEGLKDLNIELQYSKQRVRVELSDLDGEFILIKQKLEKLESGEFVLVPRMPTKNMLEAGFVDGDYGCSTLKIYKAMIEAVEKENV